MKKTIICISLLVISLTVLFIYNGHRKAETDSIAPKLTCESEVITAKVSEINDEFLLQGVSAYDDRCGDVSDTLVVQSISKFIPLQKDQVIVTYAAVDDSNNVGRLERILIYEDYTPPVFSLDRPLLYNSGTSIKFLNNIHATSSIDGDITSRIRYGLETILDNNAPASYPIEFRVTDSNGKTSYLNTHIVILNGNYGDISISLKEYLIYLPKGSKFTMEDAEKNVSSVSDDAKDELNITSDVDTKTPGVYYVDYKINSTKGNGISRLIVVVTE